MTKSEKCGQQVCETRRILRQTRGYLPGRRAPPLLHWLLLGDKGACLRTPCGLALVALTKLIYVDPGYYAEVYTVLVADTEVN